MLTVVACRWPRLDGMWLVASGLRRPFTAELTRLVLNNLLWLWLWLNHGTGPPYPKTAFISQAASLWRCAPPLTPGRLLLSVTLPSSSTSSEQALPHAHTRLMSH